MAGRRVRRTPRRSPLEPSQNGLIIIVASSPPVYLRSPVAVALDVADLAVVGGGADWRALLAGHRPALHLRNLLANLTRFRLDSSYLGTSSLVAPHLSGDVPAVLPGHLVAHLLGHLLAHLSRNLFALLPRHLHHPTNQSRSQWSRDPPPPIPAHLAALLARHLAGHVAALLARHLLALLPGDLAALLPLNLVALHTRHLAATPHKVSNVSCVNQL